MINIVQGHDQLIYLISTGIIHLGSEVLQHPGTILSHSNTLLQSEVLGWNRTCYTVTSSSVPPDKGPRVKGKGGGAGKEPVFTEYPLSSLFLGFLI